MAGCNMEDGEKPATSLRQHAATYVDALNRIAPPCDRLMTPEMRANAIAFVEWAMDDLIRAGGRIA